MKLNALISFPIAPTLVNLRYKIKHFKSTSSPTIQANDNSLILHQRLTVLVFTKKHFKNKLFY